MAVVNGVVSRMEHTNINFDFDYVGSVPDRLICCICMKVMKNPHLVVCCGQNTSGYMVYWIFKCYNFHFNNYVGFSILIKGENRTTFVVGETICLLCIAPTLSIAWEIPPFSGISDFVVSSGFPEEQQNGFNASIRVDPYICLLARK